MTDAECDQDHIPMLVDNNTRIPDRTEAILHGGASPVPEMLASAKRLEAAGADFLVIPCHTAHYFIPEIADKINIPILDMPTETAKLYSVPDLCGKTYSEILENEEEYEKFQISIVDKEFSDKYPVGVICAQSVKPKSQVEKDTAIQVTISLGPKEIEIASVKNLDEQAAKLELLKQGFLYNNIEVMEKYDEDATPGVVLDQEPKAKSKVSTDIKVKIYINSYEGEEETDSDNSDSNGWF